MKSAEIGQTPRPLAESDPVGAALWMIGAIVSFTSMAVAGRAVSFELDTFEIMMYRSFLGVGVVLSVTVLSGRTREITRRSLGVHLVRNISHFAGQNFWFYAITVIPLAQVFALEFTTPIWATLLAVIVLGENLTRTRLIASFVGFIGILIVTRPWASGISPGIVTAALAAIGFAGSAVYTRLLTRTETILCILFWLTVMQAVFGIICAGYDGDIATPSAQSLPWIVLIGFAGLVAHFCLTKALSLAPAAVVTPIDFARLPVIAIVGSLLYGESIQMATLLGALLIFASNYFNILNETRRKR
jgi:drug/metabolite transporter (DMT)-like permease